MENSTLHTEIREFTFRKETFTIVFHYLVDNERQYEYTTDELNGINLSQVYDQYRAKYQCENTEGVS
jgi:hypothetical protein